MHPDGTLSAGSQLLSCAKDDSLMLTANALEILMRMLGIVVAAAGIFGCSKVDEKPKEPEKSKIVDLQACKVNDERTKVPVWMPTFDQWSETLSSSPPQKNGQVVYIALNVDGDSAKCNDEDLNSFRVPSDRRKPSDGGIAINLRGNSQFANGTCYFAGFFMNMDVMGMHQGWGETYFGAVGMQEILLSGRYCLSDTVQEPDAATLALPSENDKVIIIDTVELVTKKNVYGQHYQEPYVSFSEKGSQIKQRAACGMSVCDSIMPKYQQLNGKSAKITLQSRLADDGVFEPIIMKVMLMQ